MPAILSANTGQSSGPSPRKRLKLSPASSKSSPFQSKPLGIRNGVNGKPSKRSSDAGRIGQLNGMKRNSVLFDEETEAERLVMVNGQSAPGHNTKRRKGEMNGVMNGKGGSHNAKAKARIIQEQRAQLPIAQGKDAIIREVAACDVTILVGETGSGKTTRARGLFFNQKNALKGLFAEIPQYLFESGQFPGQIAITQPRRVAATSLATRVSAEQGSSLGSTVGYAVRFDERTSSDTRIKYLTDGMLVREMMGDPLLERYSVVVVDEAHERSLRTDLVLASLKKILEQRNGFADAKGKSKAKANPLKVVVMSATLDAEKFSNFFNAAKVLYVKGRQHPVTIYHTSTGQTDYVDTALRTFFQIHVDQPPGDVLVFLPGQEDIESLEASVTTYAKQLPANSLGILICPLYASLPNVQQTRVFAPAPHNHRKCILATNIAETSITIPGVKYVIDTGKQKEKKHVAREYGSGFDALVTTDITKSSAMQRAGRAGREGKGYCFRLYTEDAFDKMDYSPQPEIQRTNLTSAILQLKCVGQDLETMEFMDRPEPESIGSALRTLLLLGALDEKNQITKLGRSMALFPLEPQYAAVVLASVENKCTSEILSIVSLLSSSSPLFPDLSSQRDAAADARAKFRHFSGDHLSMLNVWSAYETIASSSRGVIKEWCKKNHVNERALSEAKNIREQLVQICERTGVGWKVSCGQDDVPVLKSLVRGLVLHAALLHPDGTYKQLMGPKTVKIHPGSFLADKKAPAILYDELVYTTNIYARGVSAVRLSWVKDIPIRKPRNMDI